MAIAILVVVALRVAGFGASTLVVRQASATILVYSIPLLGILTAGLTILSPILPQFPRFWRAPTIRFGSRA
jgi:hypothetical protein